MKTNISIEFHYLLMVHWCRHLSSTLRSSHQSRLHETFANWKTFCVSLLLYTENTEKLVKNLFLVSILGLRIDQRNEIGLSPALLLVLSNVNKLFADVSLLWGVLDDSPLDQALCLSSHPQQWSFTENIVKPEESKSKSPAPTTNGICGEEVSFKSVFSVEIVLAHIDCKTI